MTFLSFVFRCLLAEGLKKNLGLECSTVVFSLSLVPPSLDDTLLRTCLLIFPGPFHQVVWRPCGEE